MLSLVELLFLHACSIEMKEIFKEFMDILKYAEGLSKVAVSLNILKHLTPHLQHQLSAILLHMKDLIENDPNTYGSVTVTDLISFLTTGDQPPLVRLTTDEEWHHRILTGVLGLPIQEFYCWDDEKEKDSDESAELTL